MIGMGQRPGGPAHIVAARDEPPEPVIDVGDPLARLAVEPGRKLERIKGLLYVSP
jgi:hypothetical protein